MTRALAPLIVLMLTVSCGQSSDSGRSRVSLDRNWRFILADPHQAETSDYDDSDWRELHVPHDWSIEGTYEEHHPAGRRGGFLPTGVGWYRKELPIEHLHPGKRYFIEFDGVYLNSDVWINGHHLGHRPNGYIGFSYDLTPHLVEGRNLLAVRVDHSQAPSGRWYTGSGIYRHVWLTTTSDIHVALHGTAVLASTKEAENTAEVDLSITLVNDRRDEELLTIISRIFGTSNALLAEDKKESVIPPGSHTLDHHFLIDDAKKWSPETPNMYVIETQVWDENELLDTYETPFGIRTIALGPEGFLLNGEAIKLKGLSNHHDAGPVGSAVPEDVLYRRLKMLKDMGANALRTAHHPFAPEFYAMCDTMGFMVLNEAFDGWHVAKATYDYGNYFEQWWKRDLKAFMHRDRNHPSVVIWSIGNEVRRYTDEQQEMIVDYARAIDDSRPITQARGYKTPHTDIVGFNGHGEFKGAIKTYHESHPDKVILGTEMTHTLQTRGVYKTKTWYRTRDNPAPWEQAEQFASMEARITKIEDFTTDEVFTDNASAYQSSYDNAIVRIGVRDDWNRAEALDYYIGNFRWTGFDYLGESFAWPARTNNFGIIDLAGFPKDHYYLYQSLWSQKPMVHLLPHWTHPGKEGVNIPVVGYTNCESAELLLNGQSLGERFMTSERQLVWNVPYEPGTIEIIAKNNGESMASKKWTTAGAAHRVSLSSDRSTVTANSKDVIHCEISVTDDAGNALPNADLLIHFDVRGPAQLLGVENGDILDLAPHKVLHRKLFKGKALLILQATDQPGIITITADSEGLQGGVIQVNSIAK